MIKQVATTAVVGAVTILTLATAVMADDRPASTSPTQGAIVAANSQGTDVASYQDGVARIHEGMQAGDQASVNASLLALIQQLTAANRAQQPFASASRVNQWTILSDERSSTSF